MKTLEEMPATLLRQEGEEHPEERSRAPVRTEARVGSGGENHCAQLQDGLDVDVFHVGFLVVEILRRI